MSATLLSNELMKKPQSSSDRTELVSKRGQSSDCRKDKFKSDYKIQRGHSRSKSRPRK